MIKKAYLIGGFAVSLLVLALAAIFRSLVLLVILCAIYIFGAGAAVICLHYSRKKERLLEFQKQKRETETYSRVCALMKEKKLFLDGDLNLETLASTVGVNKEMLSRVINRCAKMNFRQFLNRYRVQYAVSLLSEDDNLTFFELCFKSGFNSINSFNSAFLHFLGQKPTEVKHQIIGNKKSNKPIVIPAWDSYARV